MREAERSRAHPELKDVLAEASQALARLDADRLEEMVHGCQALGRELETAGPEKRAALARQSAEATKDLAILARVIEATRANLNVMNRLRELRGDRLEYKEAQVSGRGRAEGGHGDH